MSLHTPPSPSRYAPIQICCGLRFHAHLQSWLPIVFEQGDVADEFEEHAESLSGRSRHRDERQDQQYGQLGVGQSQPQFAQYHLYAQTATSTPALHYQQVDPAALTRVQLSAVFSAERQKVCLTVTFSFCFLSAACQGLVWTAIRFLGWITASLMVQVSVLINVHFFFLTHLIPSSLQPVLHKSWQVSTPAVDSDGSENITGLDLSDFPALADRSRRDGTGNPTPVLNPLAGRAPYGRPLVQKRVLFYPTSSRLPLGGK